MRAAGRPWDNARRCEIAGMIMNERSGLSYELVEKNIC